jgi:hypothetical protein
MAEGSEGSRVRYLAQAQRGSVAEPVGRIIVERHLSRELLQARLACLACLARSGDAAFVHHRRRPASRLVLPSSADGHVARLNSGNSS